MKRIICLMLMGFIVSACTTSVPPETLKNLYAVEAEARKMIPQDDVGLLYVVSPPNRQKIIAELRIDNKPAFSGFLSERFYVFCLPPKRYRLSFVGDFLIPNRTESVNVEAGEIYVRAFDQHFAAIWIIPLASSKLSEIALDEAKEELAIKRIGDDEVYQKSNFRCRTLAGR